jgi:hypothetical protein
LAPLDIKIIRSGLDSVPIVVEQVRHILARFQIFLPIVKVHRTGMVRTGTRLRSTSKEPQLRPVGVTVTLFVDSDPVLSQRIAIGETNCNGTIIVVIALVIDVHFAVTVGHWLGSRLCSRFVGRMRSIVAVSATFTAIRLSYMLAISVAITSISLGNPIAVLPVVSVVAIMLFVIAVLFLRRVSGR